MPLDAAEILCKMRQFSLIVLCILSINESSSAESPLERYQWGVERVVDGDTIKVNLPSLPGQLNPLSVRINGIDTPEKGDQAKCKKERELADKATAFTQKTISTGKKIEFINVQGWDKYHRILADVIVDGKSLGQLLIKNGLAREYKGGKRQGWCFN